MARKRAEKPRAADTGCADHTQARVHPALRCICGRTLRAFDFDITNDRIVLDCSRCHARLIEIEDR